MDQREGIVEALKVLEALDPGVLPAAVVVMAPDMGESILGNESGFVQLAIASLKAAQGEEQLLRRQAWVANADADWQIHSLKHDEAAHIYVSEPRSGKQRWLGPLIGYPVVGLTVICLTLGAITLVEFISKHL